MKKILYLTTTSYPKPLTNYFQTLVTANELANHYLVTFVTQTKISENIFTDYGITKNNNLLIREIPCGGVIHRFLYIFRVFLLAVKGRFEFIYTREPRLAGFCGFFSPALIVEVHDIDSSVDMIPRGSRIVAITRGIKQALEDQLGFDTKDILVAPDGVHLDTFDIRIGKEDARKMLGIKGNTVIMYTGVFHPWKGVDTLLKAAEIIPEFSFIIVGGEKKDIDRINSQYCLGNVKIIEKQPHREIPYYLKAADILVIPNSACAPISVKYTSPIKLFEYMASRRPIVASDLPSLREIISDNCAVFFQPDDPISLAESLRDLAASKKRMEVLAMNAFNEVRQYSWSSRILSISRFLQSFVVHET